MLSDFDFDNLRVLYVEDDETIQAIVTRILKRKVKELIVASDGQEGLEKFKEHHEHIDLIITDIEMPRMNGLQMIEHIQGLRDNQPIIILTAYNDEEHRSEHACELIVKPIRKQVLFESMDRCIKKRSEA